MEIKNVNFLNLDTLYDIVVDKFYDDNYKEIKFGRNLSQLLNHIVITLELSSVSKYEYIFLKMYTTSITKLTNLQYDVEYISKNYPEIFDNVYRLLSLLTSISEDKCIYKDEIDSYLIPSGLVTGDCIVTLSGPQLAYIITLEPRDFFIKASNNACVIINEDSPSKNKINPDYKNMIYEDESLKNYVIAEFLKGFYKFIMDKVTYIDLASDGFNYQRFLSKVQKDKIRVLNLRNPYFMCDFIEDQPKDIIMNLKNYRNDNIEKSFTINNTSFEISICSDFGVFFELMNILPYDRFLTMEGFKIPTSESIKLDNIPLCPESIKATFENRYNGRMTSLVKDIETKYGSDNQLIKRMEMTQNYISYSYIILISLYDIDKYLNGYITDHKNSKDYIVKKTIAIINQIISFTMSIYGKM